MRRTFDAVDGMTVESANEIIKKYFPQDNHDTQQCSLSLGSIDTSTPISNKQQPRKEYISCSPKSSGRIKDVACCFKAYYSFDSANGCFMFSRQFSNLSHNHEIPSDLMTVIDGRCYVNFEQILTSAENVSIQEQCHCRVSANPR